MDNPATRLTDVHNTIASAAQIAGRKATDVTLIAVSKTYPGAAIMPLIGAGVRDFGENRVQEAQEKWPTLMALHSDIRLHIIGQLQSNKAEDAVRLAHAIHAVDRLSLVSALARAMDKTGRRPHCFIQVNLEGAAQKGGCPPASLADLLIAARAANLPIAGLMTVPPLGLEPAPWFALLGKLARDNGLTGLSMGMSSDYATAVTLGATHIRVGSALFGGRA
jgi:PLP dependent protein